METFPQIGYHIIWQTIFFKVWKFHLRIFYHFREITAERWHIFCPPCIFDSVEVYFWRHRSDDQTWKWKQVHNVRFECWVNHAKFQLSIANGSRAIARKPTRWWWGDGDNPLSAGEGEKVLVLTDIFGLIYWGKWYNILSRMFVNEVNNIRRFWSSVSTINLVSVLPSGSRSPMSKVPQWYILGMTVYEDT